MDSWKAVLASNVKWILLFLGVMAVLAVAMFNTNAIRVIHALADEAVRIIHAIGGAV